MEPGFLKQHFTLLSCSILICLMSTIKRTLDKVFVTANLGNIIFIYLYLHLCNQKFWGETENLEKKL